MWRMSGGTVIVSKLTDAHRAAAVQKAVAGRRRRSVFKNRLRRGGISLGQAMQEAETDHALARMKLSELLQALPAVGKLGARDIMTQLGIAPTRRLGTLTDRQRTALLEKFDPA
jgi:hypothetical protein